MTTARRPAENDHSLLDGVEIRQPFFLAGGLTPENLRHAESVRPYCGFSSGVETDRPKDREKCWKRPSDTGTINLKG
ncbi:MAG: hypothetical protein ACLSG5_04205 [Oscillospiraceae bacterium]